MLSTDAERCPRSIVSAASTLLSWLEQQTSVGSTKSTVLCATRLQIPILIPRDAFLPWLSAQPGAHKLYFRARHSAFQVAAVGFSYLTSGPIYSSSVHHQLLAILDPTILDMRFYGAARFHNAPVQSPSPDWAPYHGYTFVLPAVELLCDAQGHTFLAANFYNPTGSQVLRRVLQNILTQSATLNTKFPKHLIPRAISIDDLTDFTTWDDTMNTILKDLTSGQYDKIVLARRKRFTFHRNAPPRPLQILSALADQNTPRQKAPCRPSRPEPNNVSNSDSSSTYPADANAYLFCLQLDHDKAFLGCTPERLFKLDGVNVLAEALAATVRRTPNEDEQHALETLLNEKNGNEHRFVVDDVTAAMSRCGFEPRADGPHVRRLPRLMHLVTHISAPLSPTRPRGAANNVFRLLSELHPTPAVCGVPRDTTINKIVALERFDRGLFAGPFGWFSAHAADFCVAIRSASVHGLNVTAYAGSGIVQASESRSEWDETELKMSAFTDLFSRESMSLTPSSNICSTGQISQRYFNGMNGHHEAKMVNRNEQEQAQTNGHPQIKNIYRGTQSFSCENQSFDPRELEQMPNVNAVWGCCLIEELCRNGVTTFFISPGSRSAPLALGVAQSRHAQFFVAHDERGAGFLAVGYARATNRAAAVITSSGTAVANLLPGTVEAAMDELPIVLLTADRPPELQSVGANQAIPQHGIFGDYVGWSKDVACPGSGTPLRNVLSDIDYAVHKSGSGTQAGMPVHINLMFRESLAPNLEHWDAQMVSDIGSRWRDSLLPITAYRCTLGAERQVTNGVSYEVGNEIWKMFQNSTHGLIVLGGGVGAVQNENEGLMVYEISSKLGWPIVSDVCGGLRFDATVQGVVHYADLLFEAPGVKSVFIPDCVLQFGERVTSKRTKAVIKNASLTNDDFGHVMVTRGSARHDEHFTLTHRICGDVHSFASFVRTRAGQSDNTNFKVEGMGEGKSKLYDLIGASRKIGTLLDEQMKQDETLKKTIEEKWIGRALMQCNGCPRLQAIFVGNSMPIRDLDMFGAERVGGLHVRVVANRGASGIDGVVSSGIGFALGGRVNTAIVVGDMSMLHDVNALHLLRSGGRGDNAGLTASVTIVVVNNGGGGIFAMLPIGQFDKLMTPTFDSKHEVRFEGICKSFGIKYRSVVTPVEFRDALSDNSEEHLVIEVLVSNDHKENAQHHSCLKDEVVRLMDATMEEKC